MMTASTSYELPHTGFLRLPQVLQYIPVSKATFWNWVKSGKAPTPIKLGPRTTAWKTEDIYHLIQTLSAQ